MNATDSEHVRLAEQFGEEAHNVLVLSAPAGDGASDACADLMTVAPPSLEDVLHVSFERRPDEVVEDWRATVGTERPARMSVVDVGETTRSTAAAPVVGGGPFGPVLVRTVPEPGNLTDLGVEVSGLLGEWADDGYRTVVCFDSVTALLSHTDLPYAFRFFHVLTSRVRSTGSFAHYHLDPNAHDDRTCNTLRSLFDYAVSWGDDGWVVEDR